MPAARPVALALAIYLAFSKRLQRSTNWKATLTPLASIMGSGFLVSAPLLAGTVGVLAMPCMGLLLLLAYAVGSAIRFNIRYFEPIENRGHGPAQDVAFASRIVRAGAYFISVTLLSAAACGFRVERLRSPRREPFPRDHHGPAPFHRGDSANSRSSRSSR